MAPSLHLRLMRRKRGMTNVDLPPNALEKGWNLLLFKVTQGSIDWGACLRITKPDGTLPEGIRASPAGA